MGRIASTAITCALAASLVTLPGCVTAPQITEPEPTPREPAEPSNGDQLADGSYVWDADGDGTLEHVLVTFCDNGDEAPSVLEVQVYGDAMDAAGIIERAYGVEDLSADEDERGPYLRVSYQQGDYYGHDHIAQCTLRVVGDEVVVEYAQDATAA